MNYTKCGYPITDDFEYRIVDHTRVKYIPFTEESEQDMQITREEVELQDGREVYIADSGNHCIRKLSVKQADVATVAGICGTPGFADGLFLTNMFNSPEMVGVDA